MCSTVHEPLRVITPPLAVFHCKQIMFNARVVIRYVVYSNGNSGWWYHRDARAGLEYCRNHWSCDDWQMERQSWSNDVWWYIHTVCPFHNSCIHTGIYMTHHLHDSQSGQGKVTDRSAGVIVHLKTTGVDTKWLQYRRCRTSFFCIAFLFSFCGNLPENSALHCHNLSK